MKHKASNLDSLALKDQRVFAPFHLRGSKDTLRNHEIEDKNQLLQVIFFDIFEILVGTHFKFFASSLITHDNAVRVSLQS